MQAKEKSCAARRALTEGGSMITRWKGKTFELKGGLKVRVVGVEMSANQRVNLTLRTDLGTLYLTTIELAMNLASC
jgi:hypothetical protein